MSLGNSEYSESYPIEKEDRIIEEKTYYKYKEIKEVNQIKLSNLKGSEDCFRIIEIEVFNNSTKISFTPQCTQCNTSNLKYLTNGILNENMFYVTNGGTVTLNLNNVSAPPAFL